MQALVFAYIQVVRVACSSCCGWPSQTLVVFFFFFFFFLGGRDIHYKDAMKETTSVCEGHPQQKLQATRTT